MSAWLRALLFLPEPASTFAERSDALHFFIIGATMVVATGVGVAGLVFLIRYRRRSATETTPQVSATPGVEASFIAIPLSFFLLWFFIGFRDYIFASTPPRDALDVYVVGKQWMWKFSYADGPSSIDVLYVPARRPVRLLLISRDVIHSFFVPDFRIKRDVLPARYTEIWFEAPAAGEHQILCAELCGVDHSVMRGRVVVLEPEAFEAWRRGQDSAESLVSQGQRVAAEQGCLKCHSLDGSPHLGPTWLGLYGRVEQLAGGAEARVDEAYLTESMMMPEAKRVAGFEPLMPSFFGRLTPMEAAALVELIKSLRLEGRPRPGAQEPIYGPISR